MGSISESRRGLHGELPRCTEIRDCLNLLDEILSADTVSCNDLAPVLAQLQDVLERRFAAESELYDEAMVRSPWIAAQLKELKARHQHLRQQLMHVARIRPTDVQTLRRCVCDLGDQLIEHEIAEDHLRQEAFPYPSWADQAIDIPGE